MKDRKRIPPRRRPFKLIWGGLWLLTVLVLALPLQERLAAAEILLTGPAEAKGAVIRLADLVAAEERAPLPPGLAQLDLGPAPLPGNTRVLDSDYIRGRVRQAGFDPQMVRMDSGGSIPVTRSSQEVTRRQMTGWVQDYLQDRLERMPGEVEIAEITVGQDLILPAGKLSYKIVPPANPTLAGKVPLSIHCYVEGREIKRVWAMAKIVQRAEVVLARKPLRRHQIIAPEDIKLVALDLAQLPSGVLTDPQEVVGRRTQRKIDPNTVLRSDLVELPPLIKRRDVVVIVAESPGLAISTLGEAQEGGRLGERIRVTNLDSRKRIYARVVDATTVRVDF